MVYIKTEKYVESLEDLPMDIKMVNDIINVEEQYLDKYVKEKIKKEEKKIIDGE